MNAEPPARPNRPAPDFQWKAPPIRPKRAMILAAGVGKRMRPVTVTTPKPLVEVAGRALIDHALDRLERAGVEHVVVNIHYLGQLIRVHVGRRKSPNIVVSDESDQLLDTGGGIVKALPHLGTTPFFLLNSDSFWIEGARPNLEWLANGWRDENMDALLMLASTVRAVGYSGRGDFKMDPAGRLIRRPEREVVPFVYAGAAILHPRLFAGRKAEPFSLNVLFDKALEAGRLFGVHMDGRWLHVGTPEAIGEAEHSIADSAA
jgi:MurNAc alpha-1-phosphate uridylyltransferase